MNQEPPANPTLWAKLITFQPDKQNIPLYLDRNEHPFANEWSISKNQDEKIYIKNISAPYLRIEETILQINEERELFIGERLCMTKKRKNFDYTSCVLNFKSELKRDRDMNLELESIKKLEKLDRIENDLKKELTCSICTNYLQKCMILTPCLHTFCGFCLFDQLKRTSQCPLCRVEAVSVAKNSVLSNVVQLVETNFSTLQKSQDRKELEEIHFGGSIVRDIQGVYIGSYVNGKKDGQGKSLYRDGAIYEGSWKNDKREGKGVIIYGDGDKYDGYWMNDSAHGIGKYFWSYGSEYEGDFKNGLRDGHGIMKFQSGGLYKGDWKNDKREGKGYMSYANGDKYDGSWINSIKHGAGKFIWSYGKEYEGSFGDDWLNGFGTMKEKDGRIWQGNWENGKIQGEGIFINSHKDKYEGKWVNDILQPEVKVEYSNGEKYEGKVDLNGLKKEGKGILTLANGDKYKGNWINDILQPQVTIEYANGDMYEGEIGVGNFQKNGKGVLTFKNGDIYDGNWMNDMQHGRGKEISRGGKRTFEGVWKEGKISGEVIMTDEDGKQYHLEAKKLDVEGEKEALSEGADVDDSKTQDSDHADGNEDS